MGETRIPSLQNTPHPLYQNIFRVLKASSSNFILSLSDIIPILEGSISPTECIDNPDVCDRTDYCVTRDIWSEFKKAMDDVPESTTLQDLVERYKDKKESLEEMYYI